MSSVDGTTRVDVLIVGGGQAGLAMGYHLAQRDRDFVILEAGARIGDAWRKRWNGLRLFTAARYDGLPGMAFPAPPSALPTKDDVADFLESYVARMRLPVRTGTSVTGLWRDDRGDGFVVAAGSQQFEATQVVVATGAYQRPRIPGFARDLAPSIRQLHSSEYRDPSQLHDGAVLVVGASNSGAEIALGVAGEHRTLLAGPDRGKMPVRPESRLGRLLDPPFWFYLNRVATLDTPIGRKALPFVRDRGLPVERVWPADLDAAGVERVYARVAEARMGLPTLDDGRSLDVANVVWCTGFRPEFGWIHLPVIGADGWPMHIRGVVPSMPGLYFIGLPFLYSAASSLIGGVGRDAEHIAAQIASMSPAADSSHGLRPVAAGNGASRPS
jgi:putative flavoprotein involved in K+ transport